MKENHLIDSLACYFDNVVVVIIKLMVNKKTSETDVDRCCIK